MTDPLGRPILRLGPIHLYVAKPGEKAVIRIRRRKRAPRPDASPLYVDRDLTNWPLPREARRVYDFEREDSP